MRDVTPEPETATGDLERSGKNLPILVEEVAPILSHPHSQDLIRSALHRLDMPCRFGG